MVNDSIFETKSVDAFDDIFASDDEAIDDLSDDPFASDLT